VAYYESVRPLADCRAAVVLPFAEGVSLVFVLFIFGSNIPYHTKTFCGTQRRHPDVLHPTYLGVLSDDHRDGLFCCRTG
jgi:hypothetical protein